MTVRNVKNLAGSAKSCAELRKRLGADTLKMAAL